MVIGSAKFTLRDERPKVHVGATRVKKVRFVGNVCQGRSVENGMSGTIEIVAFTKDEIYISEVVLCTTNHFSVLS